MRTPITENDWREMPPRMRLAFAPLDKRAFGLAVGVLLGGGVFLITAYHLLLSDYLIAHVEGLAGREYSGDSLWLLQNYFWSYSPRTWGGAAIGALWGLWAGFVMGWFCAFARNFIIAIWLLVLRSRQNLDAGGGFLDHI